jgi:peptidoglycan/xylan/chitin deacetylase (PgdA/CDA1 family)
MKRKKTSKGKKKTRKQSRKQLIDKQAVFGIIFVLVLAFIFGHFGNQIREEASNGGLSITTLDKGVELVYSPPGEKEVPEVEIGPRELKTYFVNFRFLNIREEPSIRSEIINELKEDDQVLGEETDNPEWLKVTLLNGTEGYAAKRYLTHMTNDVAAARGLFPLPILMYHYVSVPPSGSDEMRENLSVSPAVLYAHLKYLEKSGFKTVTFKDLYEAKKGTYPLPDKPMVLTFDDGYSDHYKNVFPLLKKMGLRATFFIITERVGQEGYMTWEQIREMSDAGMGIGSHAKGDIDLRFVSEREGFDQIRGSKRTLEEKLERQVYAFSYPSGHHTSWLYKVLSRSGYAFARTTEYGKYVDVHKHPYTLPALRITQTTTETDLKSWGIR